MGREYWFFVIKTAARMLNQVPGRMGRKLTSPFELVYGVKPDAKTWFEPFSIGYFPVESKSGEAASASQAQTMDGIAVGRDDDKSNTRGCIGKMAKIFFPPIPTKFGDSIGTSLLVNIPNFQAKKMTGRSSLTVFLIKKCRFTSETGVKPEAY
jgi:hypothetical protein